MVALLILDAGRLFWARVAVTNAAPWPTSGAARFTGNTTDEAIRDAASGESTEIVLPANATHVIIAYPDPLRVSALAAGD